ncbi:MAG: HD domain-containing protein [Solirubrobacteraceae bacterium]
MTEPRWRPSRRFTEALVFAGETHADQPRKGSGDPYIGHLLAVCSLVIEDGGSEDEAIAALLHDTAEDQGGEAVLDEIGERFGADVRRIVAACSDTFETPKPPWQARKEAYIAAIAHKRDDELRVSLADKVHNARAILFDYRAVGDDVFGRFKASRADTLWYYRGLADAFTEAAAGSMANELARVVEDLERTIRANHGSAGRMAPGD